MFLLANAVAHSTTLSGASLLWNYILSLTFRRLPPKEMQYLGHILSTKGIPPLPSKTQAIQQMQPPTTPKQV